ncbi:MAG: hypothetical protein ACRDS0_42475, partial [Pseudonocardiaceae bacterium]
RGRESLMTVQTWVSMVLTSLLGAGIIVFVVGYARGHAAGSRDSRSRREVASWPSAGASPEPSPGPPPVAPVVHVHMHPAPERCTPPSLGTGWPLWRGMPVIDGEVVPAPPAVTP